MGSPYRTTCSQGLGYSDPCTSRQTWRSSAGHAFPGLGDPQLHAHLWPFLCSQESAGHSSRNSRSAKPLPDLPRLGRTPGTAHRAPKLRLTPVSHPAGFHPPAQSLLGLAPNSAPSRKWKGHWLRSHASRPRDPRPLQPERTARWTRPRTSGFIPLMARLERANALRHFRPAPSFLPFAQFGSFHAWSTSG